MSLHKYLPLMVCALIPAVGGAAFAQETVTIFFDGQGDEDGVTEPGTMDFSFMGSNWVNGVVATMGIPPLYASGSFAYETLPAALPTSVFFDTPVDSVDFFFVHGFGFGPGTATLFDTDFNVIGTLASNQATTFGDPNNFVSIDPATPIGSIQFTDGVIDNFTFTTVPEPATFAFLTLGAFALLRRRSR